MYVPNFKNEFCNGINIQIPAELTNGTYRLVVEGNFPKSRGGTVFLRESNLTYSEKFLSILIQTNRFVYTGDQRGSLNLHSLILD
jgi:hypothetical protein